MSVERITSRVVLFFILGGFLFVIAKDILRHYLISTCYQVTIAKPTDIYRGYRTGRTMTYEYTIHSTKYTGATSLEHWSTGYKDDYFFLSKRYFIKVACRLPSLSIMATEYNVPDTIVTVPVNGWSDFPVRK